MDIKSVIKTFAEAWAAASLKIEQNQSQANIPALSSNYSHYWRSFPNLPSVAGVHPGRASQTLSDWLTP